LFDKTVFLFDKAIFLFDKNILVGKFAVIRRVDAKQPPEHFIFVEHGRNFICRVRLIFSIPAVIIFNVSSG